MCVGHVCRQVCRHACRHVRRHVCRHVLRHVYPIAAPPPNPRVVRSSVSSALSEPRFFIGVFFPERAGGEHQGGYDKTRGGVANPETKSLDRDARFGHLQYRAPGPSAIAVGMVRDLCRRRPVDRGQHSFKRTDLPADDAALRPRPLFIHVSRHVSLFIHLSRHVSLSIYEARHVPLFVHLSRHVSLFIHLSRHVQILM